MQFLLPTPTPYTLKSVASHGWYALAPHQWDFDANTLERVERLSDGTVVLLTLSQQAEGVAVSVTHQGNLSEEQLKEIKQNIRWMLKLDEDLSEFHALCKQFGTPWSVVAVDGRGRLLRSPTLFEDVVKTICTTNINWAQTKTMVKRIVNTLGSPYPNDPTQRAFPTAEQVYAASAALFEQDIRLGYRNDYVRQLAAEVVEGRRDLEALQTADASTKELKKALKDIKGVGNYAANTLLMLLGHYSELAIDSELTAFVKKKYYPNADKLSPQTITDIYEAWGDWKYLAYWFDVYPE